METPDLFYIPITEIVADAMQKRAIDATVNRHDIPRRDRDVGLNSRRAHDEELWRLGNRAAAVVKCVHDHVMCTDRQVMEWLGFTDMNSVRPRITEMIDAGILKVICDTLDPVTRKRVRLVGCAKQQ